MRSQGRESPWGATLLRPNADSTVLPALVFDYGEASRLLAGSGGGHTARDLIASRLRQRGWRDYDSGALRC